MAANQRTEATRWPTVGCRYPEPRRLLAEAAAAQNGETLSQFLRRAMDARIGQTLGVDLEPLDSRAG